MSASVKQAQAEAQYGIIWLPLSYRPSIGCNLPGSLPTAGSLSKKYLALAMSLCQKPHGLVGWFMSALLQRSAHAVMDFETGD